jgi:hypothetical protein
MVPFFKNSIETWITIFQIDPLLPITPARPKPKKTAMPVTPLLAQSKNRRAVTVLFTPRKQAQAHAMHPQPSPTPHSSSQSLASLPVHQAESPMSIGSAASIEQELGHLILGSDSGSESSSQDSHTSKAKKGRPVAEDVWRFFDKGIGKEESFCKFCK